MRPGLIKEAMDSGLEIFMEDDKPRIKYVKDGDLSEEAIKLIAELKSCKDEILFIFKHQKELMARVVLSRLNDTISIWMHDWVKANRPDLLKAERKAMAKLDKKWKAHGQATLDGKPGVKIEEVREALLEWERRCLDMVAEFEKQKSVAWDGTDPDQLLDVMEYTYDKVKRKC